MFTAVSSFQYGRGERLAIEWKTHFKIHLMSDLLRHIRKFHQPGFCFLEPFLTYTNLRLPEYV
jgi:hypothetical protein